MIAQYCLDLSSSFSNCEIRFFFFYWSGGGSYTGKTSQHVSYKQMHYKIFLAYTYYYKEEEKLEF